ncbi:mycofactocin-coupled SDR family oxidoreductase [Geodermatophilus sabuli]|uniref:SDR family mycofactocin-dependent oxidoreductase n=1 Tax=Geodermatophilus sabuli TaxID=1564158 RepID=A0A285E929_9ACTN|nr:mycofactocin-coupled SDR family oxidoreductase [Geodermatophilus sabuli]MBB3082536.1 SDR family mycofactocin-dependent oxidoreductase [Geodermatophilus sabuli]SNX94596.1 SDR family mycofactocin-dependent oxidoreductase [Geodermatophilus sabuli]
MAGRMDGKVVFITGAARGQGRAHAVRLAEEGADIIAVDICESIPTVTQYGGATPEDLQETVRLVEALDRRIVAEQADVRDLARLKEVVRSGVAELGRLDGVVANAGIEIFKAWDKFTEQEFRDVIDVNLVGVWNTVMATAPVLVEAGHGGSVVLISSGNGLKGGPFNLPYTASKFAVTGMGKTFAAELGKHRIRVNTVHPGPVDTDMSRHISPLFGEIAAGNEHLLSTYAHFHPDSVMDPVEISHAVLYLLSDESTWTSALALAVDGGVTAY